DVLLKARRLGAQRFLPFLQGTDEVGQADDLLAAQLLLGFLASALQLALGLFESIERLFLLVLTLLSVFHLLTGSRHLLAGLAECLAGARRSHPRQLSYHLFRLLLQFLLSARQTLQFFLTLVLVANLASFLDLFSQLLLLLNQLGQFLLFLPQFLGQ